MRRDKRASFVKSEIKLNKLILKYEHKVAIT